VPRDNLAGTIDQNGEIPLTTRRAGLTSHASDSQTTGVRIALTRSWQTSERNGIIGGAELLDLRGVAGFLGPNWCTEIRAPKSRAGQATDVQFLEPLYCGVNPQALAVLTIRRT